MGLFIASNNQRNGFSSNLKWAILDEFYQKEDPKSLKSDFIVNDLTKFEGSYRHVQKSLKGVEKVNLLMVDQYQVVGDSAGVLNFFGWTFRPVAELLFQKQDGSRVIAFREEENAITHVFMDWGGAQKTLERVPFVESRPFVFSTLFLALVLMLVAVINSVIKRKSLTRSDQWFCGLNLTLFLGFMALFGGYMTKVDFILLRMGETDMLDLILMVPIGIVVLNLLSLGREFTISKTETKFLTPTRISMVGAVIFLLFLFQWNLLGWHF